MRRAFVIRPFNTKDGIDFNQVSAALIEPALKAAGLDGGTTEQVIEAGNIREDMFGLIPTADLVLCDITIPNPNVFYELGIRHALRKKSSVLIRGTPSTEDVPFDVSTDRYLIYELAKPADAVEKLTKTLIATLASEKIDSPVFKMLPTLSEVDPDSIRVMPKGLGEEIERARAGNAAGWLRLLSQEVANRDFQWPALRMIGKAQWDIEDFDGALETYRMLINNDADDLDANIALANLYERQYRQNIRLDSLTQSDQSIKRVLHNKRATQEQRIEALSLLGRNANTQWRQTFEKITDLDKRRRAAVNRKLIEACDGYLGAYSGDLNHYAVGIAALRMCTIVKNLADQDSWEDAFDDEAEARDKKDKLLRWFDQLKDPVELAVKAAQKRLPAEDNIRISADIANAERLFLTSAKETRVKQAYKDAIQPTKIRLAVAAKTELELLSKLGIRTDLVEDILTESGLKGLSPADDQTPAVAIVAGHKVDGSERPGPRFPPHAILDVTKNLREKLANLQQRPGGLRVLSSGAPGTDIICHELCSELQIKSTICLPTIVESYSKNTFKGELDEWRSRFFKLLGKEGIDCLQLGDSPGLPKWLEGTAINEWERGNNWVLQLALSAGAPSVYLIAVWDGKDIGDGRGGTAHMVQIARAAGTVDVELIKLKDGAVAPAGS
jgi:hypothetical protein